VPCFASQRWFDLFPPEDQIIFPPVKDHDRDDVPEFSWYLHWKLPEPRLSWLKQAGQWRPLVRSYLASTAFMDSQVGRVLAKWGRIDVLVNTVGGFNWKPLVDLEPPEWRRIVATNLDSVFNMCHLVVPRMREKRFGRIVNFAAVGAAITGMRPVVEIMFATPAVANIIREKKIGCLPVVDNGNLVGILTETDIVDAFIEAMGVSGPGYRVELALPKLSRRNGSMASRTWSSMRVVALLSRYIRAFTCQLRDRTD
jgi:hypothetical protein